LVIVVMIIGLAVSITMPRVADVRRKGNLRNAAMTLAEHLRLARTTAITRAVPVEFIFDPSLAIYRCPQHPRCRAPKPNA
jgi:Tfp pilus assembly protein FimT